MNVFLLPMGILALLALLYNRGVISVKCARALLFVGTIFSASYKSCHGTIRRIIRPAESRIYQLVFSSEMSNGSVQAELLDREKKLLLCLKNHETGELFLEEGEKYYLILRFRSADGAHHLELR